MNRSRWILTLSFLGVIFGGTLAFWAVEENWSLLDALYMTVISVTTVGYGEVQPLSTAGRIVAMIVLLAGLGVFGLVISQVTSYAVGGALGGAVERRRMAWKARKMTGHTVIFGLGSRGKALSLGVEKCVVIEMDDDTATEDSNLIVFNGNAEDEGVWAMAGVDRAEYVIVTAGSDEMNLNLAKSIRRHLVNQRVEETRVIAAIEEYSSRNCFADRLYKSGVQVIGLREQSLLMLTREMTLSMIKDWGSLPEDQMKVTVQVAGPALGEVLRVIAMVVQVVGDSKPEITVYGCDRKFISSFKARFPEHEGSCRVLWKDGEFGEESLPTDEPDLAFFEMESNLRSIELAERCLSRYPKMKPDHVVACLPESGLSEEFLEGREVSPRVVSLYEEFLSRKDGVVSCAMEDEGRRIHEKYRQEADYDVEEWAELSEFHRDSNRLAALQQDVYREFWNRFREQVGDLELLEYLAKCEHRRWMAFHLMNGYRLDEEGVVREQRLRMKVHPNLIEYHELTEEDQEKDRVNVRAAIDLQGD